jgi:eukaryotic-like serine/threonine-protein kinase
MLQGEKIGPFLIERELGSGAMGSVYLAQFTQPDGKTAPIAFKMIAMGLMGNDSAMARFDRESNILKQLRHPNIVRLIATGRYKKTPFIAMEYVDGEPLDRQLMRRSRLPWETVVDYAKQLCQALQHAHEKGIIHRDLKPSNLMLTKEGVLKLTDFGIAKDTDVTALTGANSTIGTAAYMSPEQCKGDKFISNKSDLYSLGIVLYELLTGKKPFVSESTVDMFMKHVTETPTRPAKIIHEIPVWLDNLVMFLLEKDKDRRPLDAATVARMLADIEDKVQAQVSAGEVAANAKRSSRSLSTSNEITEEDKEAARAIKGKKKKKKKQAEWYTQPWLKAIPLLMGIGLIGVGVWYTFSSKSSDSAKTGENKEGVRTAVVTPEEKEGLDWETKFSNRFNSKLNAALNDDEDETIYSSIRKAMESEKKGDLKTAKTFWKTASSQLESKNSAKDKAWKWVADKRAKDNERVDLEADRKEGLVADLKKELEKNNIDETPWKHDINDVKSNTLLALRYEQFGDQTNAKRFWELISDNLLRKPEKIQNYLLARKQIAAYSIKPTEAQDLVIKNLDSKMATLKNECEKPIEDLQTDKANMRNCRNLCRDVIDLYGDQNDKIFVDHVKQAKTWLEKLQTK